MRKKVMKIKARKTRRGLSISFRAGRDEGADLADAVLTAGRTPNAAAAILEGLVRKGYKGDFVRSDEKSNLEAQLSKAPAA